MIINFFIDNRLGGPHINFFRISNIFKTKVTNVTVGKSSFSKIHLLNLRYMSKFLYPLEILINSIQIIFLFKNKKCKFISNGIYNIAPIIAGSLLRKKTYWYLLEEPNLINKLTYRVMNFLFKFEVLSISKKICKDYKILNFQYFPPYVQSQKITLGKISKSPLKILSVGNVNKVKNHFFVLESLSKYKSEFQYDVIGAKLNTQSNLFRSIKKYIKLQNLSKSIRFLGYKNQREIKRITKKKDIFLLPSLTEGCPISLLEALSMGKICVCSKVGDIPLILKNNINGFLIDLNEKSLNKTLDKIINMDQKSLKNIQLNAIRTVKEYFSKKKHYKFIFDR